MKPYFLIIPLFSILLYACHSEDRETKQKKIAQKRVEEQLYIIESFINRTNLDKSGRRVGAISFLSDLTQIPSESPGNFVGQFLPTRTDLEKWRKWYENNKTYLFFNPQTGNVGVDRNLNGERKVEEITFRPWKDNY